ncbi:hypothetical protein ACOSP7_031812 [Xanthoceras sorbifolium]
MHDTSCDNGQGQSSAELFPPIHCGENPDAIQHHKHFRWKRLARQRTVNPSGIVLDGSSLASETDFLGKVVNGVRRQFHFEEAWINLAECDMIIKENWCHLAAPVNVQGVSNNIKSCFTILGDWNIKSRARLR